MLAIDGDRKAMLPLAEEGLLIGVDVAMPSKRAAFMLLAWILSVDEV